MVLEEFCIIMQDIMTAHHWKSGPLKIPPSILDTYRVALEGFYSLSDEYSAKDRRRLSLVVKSLGNVTSSFEEDFERMLDELRQMKEYFAVD
jgi:hypothetical protein